MGPSRGSRPRLARPSSARLLLGYIPHLLEKTQCSLEVGGGTQASEAQLPEDSLVPCPLRPHSRPSQRAEGEGESPTRGPPAAAECHLVGQQAQKSGGPQCLLFPALLFPVPLTPGSLFAQGFALQENGWGRVRVEVRGQLLLGFQLFCRTEGCAAQKCHHTAVPNAAPGLTHAEHMTTVLSLACLACQAAGQSARSRRGPQSPCIGHCPGCGGNGGFNGHLCGQGQRSTWPKAKTSHTGSSASSWSCRTCLHPQPALPARELALIQPIPALLFTPF